MTTITTNTPGATAAEWDQIAGGILARWALPVVSNLDLPVSPRSTLAQPGKVPSIKNDRGEIIGIPGWTQAGPTTVESIARWRQDTDLGFCIRTGHDGIVAIDCDVDDPELAAEIEHLLRSTIGTAAGFTKRQRGSARWAVLALITDDRGDRAKQVITLPGERQQIEILGTGQQLVCAGRHPSGARYTWTAGIRAIPITAAQLQTFIAGAAMLYASAAPTTASISHRQRGRTYIADDPIADFLHDAGRVIREGANRELYIACPWESEHTNNGVATATVYFPRGSNGYPDGGFKCLHAHCAGRRMPDLMAWLKAHGYQDTRPESYPDESATDSCSGATGANTGGADRGPTAGERLQRYKNERTGLIEPCATSVSIALSDPEICGLAIAYDTFRGRVVVRPAGGAEDWTGFTEENNLELRIALEQYGFKPGRLGKELIADAVKLTAAKNSIDTMRDFLEATLPKWDGVPRAERFLATYCGAADNEYTRAVGRYFWGMLWRRASSPEPIKADISLVLIGAQGANKTRFIKALVTRPETHTELNFNLSAGELAMRMGGRIIAEFPEMVGFGKRKLEEVKAFLTLDADTYRPLYSSDQRTVTRRCLFVMTTNNRAFLGDRTGNRRYAPVEVGRFNADAIAPDLLQLWAEGKEIFKRYGGLKLHQDVEAITEALNDDFVLPDSWETAVSEWLEAQQRLPEDQRPILQSRAVLNGALGFDDKQVKREDLSRMSEIMQALGYSYGPVRVQGRVVKAWIKRRQEGGV